MELIETIKQKANRAFWLAQRARSPSRKRKLRDLYRHYYRSYRRQLALGEGLSNNPPDDESLSYGNQI